MVRPAHLKKLLPLAFTFIFTASACGDDSTGGAGGAGTGVGGSGAGGSGTGAGGTGAGGTGGAAACIPGSVERCFDGPAGTEGVGICAAGQRTCADDGSGYGPCEGQVTPGEEDCATMVDENCNGQVNEAGAGCLCEPGSTSACYSGAPGTEGVGACIAGQRTCGSDGRSYGPCIGGVFPAPESCATPLDDDCDGEVNEAGAGCACTPGTTAPCYSGPAGTDGVGACVAGTQRCNAEGMGYGPCQGEVTPAPETCATPIDDDCDGRVNEEGADCGCVPNTTAPCYSGPAGTEGVGACTAGTMTCNADGIGYGPCQGEVTPAPETCATPVDDDCDGQVNEEGAGCICAPSTAAPCYSGPAGTEGVGACVAGTSICNAEGTAYSPCTGEVTPAAETCATPGDDDCDGQINEEGAGCTCVPNSTAPCYSGPSGSDGVGLCHSGTMTCNATGTAYGACTGEVAPVTEACGTPGDDNCDGRVNEGCVSYATDVRPIYQRLCAACHTAGSSGGFNVNNYATTQLPAVHPSCVGRTKGACSLVRIQNGSMPLGRGCSGNPTTDAANSNCLTSAEQATVTAWIAGGQLP
jgi:hypothetical protein